MINYLKKINQGFKILKLTKFKYFRASQIRDGETFYIQKTPVCIEGQSALSMLLEIVNEDVYHLKKQHSPKIIVDVGANIGIFSIFASILFPDAKVFAFEPSDSNFELLKKNTKQFQNIHCLNLAVSNYNGTAYLSGVNDHTAFKLSTLNSDHVLQKCDTIKLESFMIKYKIENIDVLKLDCEGAEYEIVEGNVSRVKQIMGEYHLLENKETNDLRNMISKQGFSIEQWTITPTGNAGIFWAINKSLQK